MAPTFEFLASSYRMAIEARPSSWDAVLSEYREHRLFDRAIGDEWQVEFGRKSGRQCRLTAPRRT